MTGQTATRSRALHSCWLPLASTLPSSYLIASAEIQSKHLQAKKIYVYKQYVAAARVLSGQTEDTLTFAAYPSAQASVCNSP